MPRNDLGMIEEKKEARLIARIPEIYYIIQPHTLKAHSVIAVGIRSIQYSPPALRKLTQSWSVDGNLLCGRGRWPVSRRGIRYQRRCCPTARQHRRYAFARYAHRWGRTGHRGRGDPRTRRNPRTTRQYSRKSDPRSARNRQDARHAWACMWDDAWACEARREQERGHAKFGQRG